jgi:DNA-binding NtrC family response regulator
MRTSIDPSTVTGSAPVIPLLVGVGYHDAVSDFKRRLIEATLHQAQGNRTHAARALGLQRTYLLRLIRELGVAAPPPPPRGRSTGLRRA